MKDGETRVRWIPVSRALPPRNGYYMVTNDAGHVFAYIHYYDGLWNAHSHSKKHVFNDVVAWAETPKPYEEKGEEK